LRVIIAAGKFHGVIAAQTPTAIPGHAPAEAALGKEALNQRVFENAVSLYKIPATLPH